jgi:hypothetical protein
MLSIEKKLGFSPTRHKRQTAPLSSPNQCAVAHTGRVETSPPNVVVNTHTCGTLIEVKYPVVVTALSASQRVPAASVHVRTPCPNIDRPLIVWQVVPLLIAVVHVKSGAVGSMYADLRGV